MKIGDKLKLKSEEYKQEYLEFQFEKIMFELEKAIIQGYKGCYYGYYISPDLGKMLEKENIKYTTYTDGEFQQSKIWIE